MDFSLRKSLQVDGNRQITGTVDPQITIATATTSGTTIGEADSLYGIVQSVSTTNPPSGFTGSFGLAVRDGTGQTLTVLADSDTVFEGDGVTSLSDLTAETFVEVDAIVNTSGQIIAQTVDAEEQTSSASQRSAFLGKVINVTRDGSGNATAFTLLIDDEIPDLSGSIPLHKVRKVRHRMAPWRMSGCFERALHSGAALRHAGSQRHPARRPVADPGAIITNFRSGRPPETPAPPPPPLAARPSTNGLSM